jgi:hypothetical protein
VGFDMASASNLCRLYLSHQLFICENNNILSEHPLYTLARVSGRMSSLARHIPRGQFLLPSSATPLPPVSASQVIITEEHVVDDYSRYIM